MMETVNTSWDEDDDDDQEQLDQFLVIAESQSDDNVSVLQSPLLTPGGSGSNNDRVEVEPLMGGYGLDMHEAPNVGFTRDSFDDGYYNDPLFPSSAAVVDNVVGPTVSEVANSLLREALLEERPDRYYASLERRTSNEVTVFNEFVDDNLDDLGENFMEEEPEEEEELAEEPLKEEEMDRSLEEIKPEPLNSCKSAHSDQEMEHASLSSHSDINNTIPIKKRPVLNTIDSCEVTGRICERLPPLDLDRASPQISETEAQWAASAFNETVPTPPLAISLRRNSKGSNDFNHPGKQRQFSGDVNRIAVEDPTLRTTRRQLKEPFLLSPELASRFELIDVSIVLDRMSEEDVERYYRPPMVSTGNRKSIASTSSKQNKLQRNKKDLDNFLAPSTSDATITVRKKRKIEKPLGRPRRSSESRDNTNDTRPRTNSDSFDDKILSNQPIDRKKLSLKIFEGNRQCFFCQRWLSDCVDEWKEKLNARSVFCSKACIYRQVDKAKEVFDDVEEHVIVMDRSGKVVGAPIAPRLRELKDFLLANSDYCPVLPAQRSSTAKKSSQNVGTGHQSSSNATDEAGNKDFKLLSKNTDLIRNNVRRLISENLSIRVKKVDGVLCSITEMKAIAHRTEAELFRQCGQNTGGRYRIWFRHFLTQLKDPDNMGLFRRVISGAISAPKLVSLEPSELADEALSTPPADAVKPQKFAIEVPDEEPKRSVLNRRQNCAQPPAETAPPMASTVILATPSTSAQLAADAIIAQAQGPPPPPPPGPPPSQRSTLDRLLGPDPTDRTAEHKSHLFDENCQICRHKKARQKEEEIKRKRSEQKREKIREERELKRRKEEQRRELEAEQRRYASNAPYGRGGQLDPTDDLQADDLGDFGVGGYDSGGEQGPSIAEQKLWTSEDLRVWFGRICMPNYFEFPCHLSAVSNPVSFKLRRESDMPAKLMVSGRIPPTIVWEYLKDLREKNVKDICVLKVDPPQNPDERLQYDGLLNNMRAKARYSVVENPSTIIKDFYLLPLVADDTLPEALLPLDGIGLDEVRPNLIICVVVRHRDQSFKKHASGPTARHPVLLPTPQEIPLDAVSSNQQSRRNGTTLLPDPNISPTMVTVAEVRARAAAATATRTTRQFGSPASDGDGELWAGPQLNEVGHGNEGSTATGDDTLLPIGFFDSILRAGGTSAMDQQGGRRSAGMPRQRVESVGDLLVAIATGDDPGVVSEMVNDYITTHQMAESDVAVISKALTSKITIEKAKRGELVEEAKPEQQQMKRPRRSQLTPVPADKLPSVEGDDPERDRPFSPSDFDNNTERPLSFLGAGTKLAKRAPLVLKWTNQLQERRKILAKNEKKWLQNNASNAINNNNNNAAGEKNRNTTATENVTTVVATAVAAASENEMMNEDYNGYFEELSEWRSRQQQPQQRAEIVAPIVSTTASTVPILPAWQRVGVPAPGPAPSVPPPPPTTAAQPQSVAMEVDSGDDSQAFSSLFLPPPPPPPNLTTPIQRPPAPLPVPHPMQQQQQQMMMMMMPPVSKGFSMPGEPELAAFGYEPEMTTAATIPIFGTPFMGEMAFHHQQQQQAAMMMQMQNQQMPPQHMYPPQPVPVPRPPIPVPRMRQPYPGYGQPMAPPQRFGSEPGPGLGPLRYQMPMPPTSYQQPPVFYDSPNAIPLAGGGGPRWQAPSVFTDTGRSTGIGPKTPPPVPRMGAGQGSIDSTIAHAPPHQVFDEDAASDGDSFFIGGSIVGGPQPAAVAPPPVTKPTTRPDSTSAQSESSAFSQSTHSEAEDGPRVVFGRKVTAEELAASVGTELEEGEIIPKKAECHPSHMDHSNPNTGGPMDYRHQPPYPRSGQTSDHPVPHRLNGPVPGGMPPPMGMNNFEFQPRPIGPRTLLSGRPPMPGDYDTNRGGPPNPYDDYRGGPSDGRSYPSMDRGGDGFPPHFDHPRFGGPRGLPPSGYRGGRPPFPGGHGGVRGPGPPGHEFFNAPAPGGPMLRPGPPRYY